MLKTLKAPPMSSSGLRWGLQFLPEKFLFQCFDFDLLILLQSMGYGIRKCHCLIKPLDCAKKDKGLKTAISTKKSKGIYNRLPLIMSYLLDIDLAL